MDQEILLMSKIFLDLKNRLKEKVKNIDLFHCFIEINEPSIEICIKKILNIIKNYIFFHYCFSRANIWLRILILK